MVPPKHDVVCFDCQQSAEKYLKALLEELGLAVPRIHSLDDVLSLLVGHHSGLRSLRRGLIFLTDFAVEVRYPGDSASNAPGNGRPALGRASADGLPHSPRHPHPSPEVAVTATEQKVARPVRLSALYYGRDATRRVPGMAHRPLDAVIRHIRKVAGGPLNSRESDQELLQRFVDHQDRTAFAALVQRHGPMVRSVCWRLLRHEADVDDAFQATFLVLLHKACTIRRRPSLASWLYGVAFRTALKAKSQATQRQAHEQRAIGTSPAEPWREAAWREICTVLDEEVQGLSERYRAPLVLCYLEGRTRDEAAHQLGWSLRTLQRRLERGREILRTRLIRRGLNTFCGIACHGPVRTCGRRGVTGRAREPYG